MEYIIYVYNDLLISALALSLSLSLSPRRFFGEEGKSHSVPWIKNLQNFRKSLMFAVANFPTKIDSCLTFD